MRRKVPDWALRGRAKSLLIYLPPEIKAALDAMATQAGLSRSAMIAGLVSSALAQGWPKSEPETRRSVPAKHPRKARQ